MYFIAPRGQLNFGDRNSDKLSDSVKRKVRLEVLFHVDDPPQISHSERGFMVTTGYEFRKVVKQHILRP